jgi:glycosyltransferase involved in cell wall biosynthesis
MAAGCVLLASDTDPHREIVTPGQTGLLVEGQDAEDLRQRALAVLADPAAHRPLGDAAAALVQERFSQDVCLPRLAEQLTALAAAGARGGRS